MLVLAGHLEQFGLSPKANGKAVTYFKLWKQYGHIRIEHISMIAHDRISMMGRLERGVDGYE